MDARAEYTRRTGRNAERTAGYISRSVLWHIATFGDVSWGAILDNPSIPYTDKIERIHEIAEVRLGKGSAWSPDHTEVLMIPRTETVESWDEVNSLLRHALSADESERGE